MTSPLPGAPLADVDDLVDTIPMCVWRHRSLCFGSVLPLVFPRFRHASGDGAPNKALAGTVGMGFENTHELRNWFDDRGILSCMTAPEVSATLSDKLNLINISETTGIRIPRSMVQAAGEPCDPSIAFDMFQSDIVVVQKRADNLVGRGTKVASTDDELRRIVREWSSHPVKISAFIPGIPLTLSGTVLDNDVLVTAMSLQLVGLPELTGINTAHCGNQLIDDSELPSAAVVNARSLFTAVGREAERRGFRGQLGIDFILQRDASPVLIEINSRMQAVSSLISWLELSNGLAPQPVVQVLSAIAPMDSFESIPANIQPLSQVAVASSTATVVRNDLRPGRYVLDNDTLVWLDATFDVSRLSEDEAIVWPFRETGEEVSAGGRLAMVQYNRAVSAVSESPTLLPHVSAWISAIRAAMTGVR